MSDSLQPYRLQHARLPCLSPTPRVCSNSCPSSWWCHPTISSSVVPFSSCLQSFPASGYFPMTRFFAIRCPKHWSFHFSISPSSEYSGLISFRIYWFNLLPVKGTLMSLLQHHSSKASILWGSAFFMVQLSHLNMTTGKTIALTIQTFVSKVMSLLLISSPTIYSLLIYTSGNPFPIHIHVHIYSFDFLAFFLYLKTVQHQENQFLFFCFNSWYKPIPSVV